MKGSGDLKVSIALAGEIVWLLGIVAWYVIRYPFERRAKRVRVVSDRRSRSETVGLASALVRPGDPAWILRRHRHPENGRLSGQHCGPSLSARSSSPPRCGFFADPTRSLAGTGRSRWRFASSTNWSAPGHTLWSATRCTRRSCSWALARPFCCRTGLSGLAGLIGFAVLFFLRVDKEERMMLENFGPQYRAYMERTKRIIPYLY